MEISEVLQILKQGEDSKVQFKENIERHENLAAEMVAFSNTIGGKIFIGVDDSGIIKGLSSTDINRINQMISNVASEGIKPAINPITEVMTIDDKRILIVSISEGLNKYYQDKNGSIWVISGADKRKATAREEIQRLFQSSRIIQADEELTKIALSNLDLDYFTTFFKNRYHEELDDQKLPISNIIDNMNLGRDGFLNLAGALLFSKNPSNMLPAFIVKAVSFPGNTITADTYIDSRDIRGKFANIYQECINFLMSNIKMVQKDQNVNSVGIPEIPKIVFEELVANALIHRDYFISAPIRIFVFVDRIEIISPGHLPNSLTVENIKRGNSVPRNNILASFANYIIPYRVIGSGIMRALENYPDIEFVDNKDDNLFKCIIKRKFAW
ncbi:MAG: putative DNA binding domain-containing protein [Candidatus Cloacimonetes bacterium]|nr:putative DNA binding domain-containing protein [Candidatus Cloacimonadota bacterium]